MPYRRGSLYYNQTERYSEAIKISFVDRAIPIAGRRDINEPPFLWPYGSHNALGPDVPDRYVIRHIIKDATINDTACMPTRYLVRFWRPSENTEKKIPTYYDGLNFVETVCLHSDEEGDGWITIAEKLRADATAAN